MGVGYDRGCFSRSVDENLLRALQSFRVIDREQAKRLGPFTSTSRANTRLLQLVRAGQLKRFSPVHSRTCLYRLPRGRSPVNGITLQHQLALNALCLLIAEEAQSSTPLRIVASHASSQPLSTLIPLVPDGYLEIECDANTHHVFLELDLGTEGLPIWRRKAELYFRLASSGEFERLFGNVQFRVAVITEGARRAQSIARCLSSVTKKLFFLRSIENINKQGFFQGLWLRPDGSEAPLLS